MDVRDVLGMSSSAGGGGAGAASAHAHTQQQQHASSAHASASSSSSHRSHHVSSSSSGGGGSSSGAAIPRELAQLQSELSWSGSQPLAPQQPISQAHFLKSKRVKAVSWRLLPIRSSARASLRGGVTDDVQLLHWVKIHNVPDYRFARFNKAVRMMDYTHEEYESYLHDATWSRAETDRLMQLAHQFDLRFILMEDRFNAPRLEAEREREQAKLQAHKEGSTPKLSALLPSPQQQETKEQQQAAATNITLAPNVTMSTHAAPAVAAESKDQQEASASTAANMDTSADSAQTAAATTAAESTNATAAAASSSSSDAAATSAAAPASGDVAAAAAVPTVSAAPGSLPVNPLAPSLVSPSQPLPAIPPELLALPDRPSTVAAATYSSPLTPLIFPHRTVEALKSRFYFIQQTLASLRNSSDPDLRKTNPLFTHPYDATHELLRKAQLERLYQRTAQETTAMAEMVLEHRNIQAAIKRIKKGAKDERDVLRGGGGASHAKGASSSTKGRDRSGASHKKSASGALGAGAAGSSSLVPKRAGIPQPLVGEMAPLPPSCDASSVLPVRGPGVFLRSAQLASNLNVSAKQAKFLESELASLNVRRARDCSVATGVVCDQWDRLRVNILTLANLQGYVHQREVMRDDLRIHSSIAPAGGAGGAAAAAAGVQSTSLYNTSLAQAAVIAAHRKKVEKRKMEGEAEQDDKRARKK